MTNKEQRVWTYLLNNRRATAREVAEATGVTEEFVHAILARIGSPEEVWRGADNGAGEWNAAPSDTEDEEILMSYPDDNPKTQYGEQKPKLSSTPVAPLFEMGKVFELGAKKYGRFNWRLHTVSATVYYDAALRHLMAWFEGEDLDPESGVPHLAHAMACMVILMDAKDNNKLNDNRLDAEDTL